jgi:hypothetical protein
MKIARKVKGKNILYDYRLHKGLLRHFKNFLLFKSDDYDGQFSYKFLEIVQNKKEAEYYLTNFLFCQSSNINALAMSEEVFIERYGDYNIGI